MADGRRREAWQHTAWLAALIANANRDRKKHPRPFTPDEFNPHAKPSPRGDVIEVNKGTVSLMKEAFTGRKGP